MIRFFKLSGGGNDFIALAEPETQPDTQTIRQWCRRGVSIGADGVFVLSRELGGLKLDYWNSDGGPAAFCGNAARCAVVLAHELGWIGERCRLKTLAGELDGRIIDPRTSEIEAPLPRQPVAQTITTSQGSFDGWSTAVGVPHFVISHQGDLASLDVNGLAPEIRSHPDFGADGTNVDWIGSSGSDEQSMTIRSFERGVESETLACGSGVLAAAAACVAAGQRLPLEFTTRGGFRFQVLGQTHDRAVQDWRLSGDARLVASGVIEAGALSC